MASSPRSATVDESLVRRVARDAAIYSLTRPVAIVMWVALAVALALNILTLMSPRNQDSLSAWMPVIIVAVAGYTVVMTVSTARRAVRVAMPPESVVWASLEADALILGSDRRRSALSYDTFQGMRVGSNAVLLKIRGAAVATAIPRALLTDADITALRAKLA